MASELAEQLNRLGHKAELLTTRYAMLREQNAQLREEVEDLRATLQTRNARIERLEIELENMRVSSVLAPDSESVGHTQAMISDLVREIDACVADLMGDI